MIPSISIAFSTLVSEDRACAGAAGLVTLALLVAARLLSHKRRRRLVGFVRRIASWEFWPSWAAYAPVLPYLCWLGLKHRSTTLFTAANPGIPAGGLVGESKSAILAHLGSEREFLPKWQVVSADTPYPEGLGAVVLKPDVGERGCGVAVIRSEQEWDEYLRQAAGPVIAQEYVAGEEFGILYRRYPWEERGGIVSIAGKRLPSLTGDGRSTLESLILDDPRAVCLHEAYLRQARRDPGEVPHAGERVPLVEIGSHCRGAIFADAHELRTDALENAIDSLGRAHPGFYIGRFDVRAESAEALREGRFKVLELNGIGGEPAHIYDPAVSLWQAYAALFRHWRDLFEIGAANRAAGARPMPPRDLIAAWLGGQRRRSSRRFNSIRLPRNATTAPKNSATTALNSLAPENT